MLGGQQWVTISVPSSRVINITADYKCRAVQPPSFEVYAQMSLKIDCMERDKHGTCE
jgi:hypothetical protein